MKVNGHATRTFSIQREFHEQRWERVAERESWRNVNRNLAQDKSGQKMSDLENQTENFALRTRMKPPVTSAQGNTIR